MQTTFPSAPLAPVERHELYSFGPPQTHLPEWLYSLVSGKLERLSRKDGKLAKPNYQYAKRQKDLAKQQRQEQKRQQKLNKNSAQPKDPQSMPPEPPADEKPVP